MDLLNLLWAPASVLDDAAKAAAVAAYIPFWAKGQVWAYENPDAWNEEYYVETQNLTAAQAQAITELANKPLFPPSWDEAIAWEQETADLLAEGGFVKKFDVELALRPALRGHRGEGRDRGVPEVTAVTTTTYRDARPATGRTPRHGRRRPPTERPRSAGAAGSPPASGCPPPGSSARPSSSRLWAAASAAGQLDPARDPGALDGAGDRRPSVDRRHAADRHPDLAAAGRLRASRSA